MLFIFTGDVLSHMLLTANTAFIEMNLLCISELQP